MVKSPLSSKPPEKIRDLPREMLLRELGDYFGSRPPDDVVDCDYSLWRCVETGFEFAGPGVPGNRAFYEWISGFSVYYPAHRWEYGKVGDLLMQRHACEGDRITLVDVGCGSGEFMDALPARAKVETFGIDMNQPAIESCRKRGLPAYCGTLQQALESGAISRGQCNYVTSFHCLEHVPDPVGFISEMIPLLKPGGSILVSTPYSPMSFETDWFDVMNHPPHHLGRWNLRAYRALAARLGLEFSFFMPPASSALSRAWQTLRLVHLGAHRRVGKVALAGLLLRRIPSLAGLWRRQLSRSKIDGSVAADVILVELRRK